MRADQVYYTSCRVGLSPGAGYKIRAASIDLGADVRGQVESLSGYKPPDTLPPEPNVAQIATCPVSFRFARLTGGRWAITRARYIGLDYSDRWGNFFAHTLVGPAGPIDRYPIDYYEWEGWREGLAPGEGDKHPEPLSQVDLEAISDASSFTAAELANFLGERSGRRERLANMIRAVQTYAPGKGQPIIVRDTDLNNIFWIACLQKALPLRYVQELTFCTYLQDSRRHPADLNATVEGTLLSMMASDLRGRYCGFDELNGTASVVPGEVGDFGERMSHWLAMGDGSPRQAFFHFLAHFDHRIPDVGLNAAVWLFELPNNERVGGPRLGAMLEFLVKYTQASSWPNLLPQLQALLERVDWSGRAAEYENFLGLLGKAAQMGEGNAEIRRLAKAGWQGRYVERLLEGGSSEILTAVRQRVANLGEQASLEDLFLESRPLNDLLSRAAAQRVPAIMAEVVAALRRRGRERPWTDTAFALALAKIDGPALDAVRLGSVFALFPDEAEALADIAARLAPDTQSIERQRLVADTLIRLPVDIRQRIRSILGRQNAWGLLRAEWLSVLRSASDKDGALQQHGEALRRICPEFAEREWPSMAAACWKELPKANRSQVAQRWLDLGAGRLPPEVAQECVRLAAVTFPLNDDPTSIARAEAMTREAQRLRMDIPLRARLQALLTRPANEVVAQVVALAPGLEPALYKEFLEKFLKRALATACEGEDVACLFADLTAGGGLNLLRDALVGLLRGFATLPWPPVARAALIQFLLMEESRHVKGLAIRPATSKERHDALIAGMKKLGQDDLNAIARAVEQLGGGLFPRFEKDVLMATQRSSWWPF